MSADDEVRTAVDWSALSMALSRHATEIYAALKTTGRLRKVRPEPLTYWCAVRCST